MSSSIILVGLGIKASDLEELYERVLALIEGKRLREAIDMVLSKCIEWVDKARGSKGGASSP